MTVANARHTDTHELCRIDDLVAWSGVVALHQGHQLALFYLPRGCDRQSGAEIFALDNHDPFSGANVIGRGIIGDKDGEPVVASPIYKQHFRLRDGVCLEDPEQRLTVWPVRLKGDLVVLEP
ncbi:nitrite reductase small subunit NirD [Kushneria marisflavi]|uniref:Nitrite reductase (NAD(P)H) small subunit n=1 Tax=Kushneria marisflavi TaxID=157779 RepID=A0A240UPA8_9GAMM|nr:nitrite reductase small subunit NirD [Kushneria marisflavi]ART62859.1 nitrite reductase (NAD(P)H) small subunit [Kushneria marisflavi]RKD84928.1 nitrite reductase (NADH) small subunit [Kushneria marisflavi]